MNSRRSKRVVAGTGLSLGATLGMAATAEAVDFTVTNAGDGPSGGTLREAINLSNSNNNDPTVDRILFQSSVTGQITISGSDLPDIVDPLQIVGPGANVLTISGGNAHRIFKAAGEGPVTISGLRLVDGYANGYGGAVYAQSEVTIERTVVHSNTALGDGGGVMANGAPLTIRDSTFTDNDSPYGGAIAAAGAGAVTITGSTISSNDAGTYGAGIHWKGGSTLTVEGSTITGNNTPGIGGGIRSSASATDPVITSSIVANNTASSGGPNLAASGGDAFSIAFSLIEDPSGVGINATGPNITGQDPQLAPLAANGGPTPTHALAATSPALDRGSATGTDQRGLPRVSDFPGLANATGGNGADIGAFELQARACVGKTETRPTTVGTAGADVIVGTTAADVIRALGGNDLVCAGAGNDKASGGGGKDTLRGEAGRDTLRGQGGRDRLIGGPGRDRLIGGLLRDILRGGPGRDRERQ